MKVFIAGDHRTGTGPANVTKEYIKHCPEKVLFQKRVGKIARVPEMLFKIMASDVVLFSGYSRQNLLGIKLAKIFGRKTAYLMHGCVEHENEINGVPDPSMNDCERRTMAGVDAVYAVSERFAKWLKIQYPEYAGKIDFVINGVDGIKEAVDAENAMDAESTMGAEMAEEKAETEEKSDNPGYMIFSIGGGMPRKKIRHICEAIRKLREEGLNISLTVVGDNGLDDEAINAYEFVDNQGLVDHDRVARLFKEADLFVQNSCFETFGLAPVEALCMGCSVLLSDKVGALDIIPGATDADIIYDYSDANEIAGKIKGIMDNPNSKRMSEGIDFDKYSWTERGKVLWEKLKQLQN